MASRRGNTNLAADHSRQNVPLADYLQDPHRSQKVLSSINDANLQFPDGPNTSQTTYPVQLKELTQPPTGLPYASDDPPENEEVHENLKILPCPRHFNKPSSCDTCCYTVRDIDSHLAGKTTHENFQLCGKCKKSACEYKNLPPKKKDCKPQCLDPKCPEKQNGKSDVHYHDSRTCKRAEDVPQHIKWYDRFEQCCPNQVPPKWKTVGLAGTQGSPPKIKTHSQSVLEPSTAGLKLLRELKRQLKAGELKKLRQNLDNAIRDMMRRLSNNNKQCTLEQLHPPGSQTSLCSSQSYDDRTHAIHDLENVNTTSSFVLSVTDHDSPNDPMQYDRIPSTFPQLEATENSSYYSAQSGTQPGSSFTMDDPDGMGDEQLYMGEFPSDLDDNFEALFNLE